MSALVDFKPGELKTLKDGILPPELSDSGLATTEVKVVGMEHRYGYNRFVLVELDDDDKTRLIVSPGDFI